MDFDFLFMNPGIGDTDNLDDYVFQLDSPRSSQKRASPTVSNEKEKQSDNTSELTVLDLLLS